MDKVRPKKSLGQHFLHDQVTAQRIVAALKTQPQDHILEIGPGMGVLTKYLMTREAGSLVVAEIDRDSVAYLKGAYPTLQILEGDFLELDLNSLPGPLQIIGNFPYNISSQIFFHILDYRDHVTQVVCMLQKEVADRLAASHGNKTYGILSVLLQTWYKVSYRFKVMPGAFNPPPKVISAVIQLERNSRTSLECDYGLFVKVVKQGFNNRRKTLRNALKSLNLPESMLGLEVLDKRAEQLSVDDFIKLTVLIAEGDRK